VITASKITSGGSMRKPPGYGRVADRSPERLPSYLRTARGYSGPIPRTLAFLLPSKPEHHPAMMAAFGVCDEPEPGIVGEPLNVDSVHLTLLKPDGSGKADIDRNKRIVGRPLARPIAVAPPMICSASP
jgi:hypothetical protein